MSDRSHDDNVERNVSSSSIASKYVPPHQRSRMLSSTPAAEPSRPAPRTGGSPWGAPAPSAVRSGPGASPWSDKPRGSDNRENSRGGWSSSSRGTHWDTPDPRLERELFGTQISSGINFDKYDDIPVEVSGREIPPRDFERFQDAHLGPILSRNIELAGYQSPTPIQKNAVPIVMAGRDLMACAQTGSGKTAAFLFPTLARLCADYPNGVPEPSSGGYGRRRKAYPSVLIMSPTRELAQQIHKEASKFCYRSPFRCCVAYGGADIGSQLREIEKGCDILVATPGRLSDMLERGRVSLSQIRFFVMDEADRMLDMGFEPQIRHIVEKEDMPPQEERQTLMFSATFPREIQQLATDFLQDYVFLQVGRVGSATESIQQRVVRVDDRDKKDTLLDLLDSIQGLTLVFVETKRNCDYIEDFLYDKGYPAVAIHGDRTQQERDSALRMFRSEERPILVATDVAARGLDIDNVLHVINYDLPHDINDYVHRIGRTGRAGHTGVATAMVNEKNSSILKDLVDILAEASQEVPDWLLSMSRNSRAKGRTQTRDFRSAGGGGGGGRRGGGSSSRYGEDRGGSSRGGSNFGGGAW